MKTELSIKRTDIIHLLLRYKNKTLKGKQPHRLHLYFRIKSASTIIDGKTFIKDILEIVIEPIAKLQIHYMVWLSCKIVNLRTGEYILMHLPNTIGYNVFDKGVLAKIHLTCKEKPRPLKVSVNGATASIIEKYKFYNEEDPRLEEVLSFFNKTLFLRRTEISLEGCRMSNTYGVIKPLTAIIQ